MNCLGQDLRLELPVFIRKHTNSGRKVIIDLHEPQSRKPVEPGIGNFLHHLIETFFLHLSDQRRTLLLLIRCQKNAMRRVRIWICIRADFILICLLRHALNEFVSCPDGVFLYCILIHERVLS
ncbi:unknown [Dialister sp. CAG:357]|nr:unknown [Dialister sp. CAG:357]